MEQQVNDLHLNVKHHSQPINPFYQQPESPNQYNFFTQNQGYYENSDYAYRQKIAQQQKMQQTQQVHQQKHQQVQRQHSQVQRQPSNDMDRYAALANLDAKVKAEKVNERRHQFQKQISIGQQIFGAAPSSVNPFLTKNPSNASTSSIQPSPAINLYQTNPFSTGHPSNPFM